MSKTDEYRQVANDCIVWARIATSDDQREQFLELAKKWMSDAESIDRGTELQPNEAVKASEMAGEEIDRLGDPLATDEERQLRKRRLIEGPQEFRDIRSNRAKIKPGFPRVGVEAQLFQPLPPPCSKCGTTTVVTPAFEKGQRVFVVRCPACGRASTYSLNYGALRE